MWYLSGTWPFFAVFSSTFSTSCAARPVDWCVTEGCSASSWFSRKIFQFECWITRKQFGTTSTLPSGERSQMSSNATFGSEAREHEAAIVLHARCALHVAVGVVAPPARALVARLHHRDVLQRAVEMERPRVVRAAEELAGVPAAVAAHHRAAVRAAVVEHVHASVLRAHHDHRLAADLH